MGFLGETIDLNDMPVAEKRDFDPVPAGWYTVAIAGAELRDTKAGTGKYISVRFDITGPEHQGRVVFTNLNTRNPNPKAEEIGRQQLGEIMRAIGVQKLEDTDELIGGNLSIKVTVKNDPTYGAGNEVKGFRAIEGSVLPVSAPAPAAAPAASAPWAK
jgi:hypothetical protein|tara:strand:+ start:452 stop:925 length:474 start_codon:yes stop_codon:yes gene_type:complete